MPPPAFPLQTSLAADNIGGQCLCGRGCRAAGVLSFCSFAKKGKPPAIDQIAGGSLLAAIPGRSGTRPGGDGPRSGRPYWKAADFNLLADARVHQTMASMAVMKANAAQIEKTSTLIADVIVKPSGIWVEAHRKRIPTRFTLDFIL